MNLLIWSYTLERVKSILWGPPISLLIKMLSINLDFGCPHMSAHFGWNLIQDYLDSSFFSVCAMEKKCKCLGIKTVLLIKKRRKKKENLVKALNKKDYCADVSLINVLWYHGCLCKILYWQPKSTISLLFAANTMNIINKKIKNSFQIYNWDTNVY